MLAAAVAGRAVVAMGIPPQSDVYYYLAQATSVFLSGGNPYVHTYTGIPTNLLTPGAAQIFAYLPMSFLYLVPFFLAGDVRLGMVAADLIIGTCLFLYGGRWRFGAALVYLFLPFTILFSTVYLNTTAIAMAFIALFLLAESRGRGRLGAVLLGLAIATVQFAWLMLPGLLVYYYRTRRWLEPLIVLATAAVIMLPFLAFSGSSFLGETLTFQFGRPVIPIFVTGGPVGFMLNPSMNAFSLAIFGATVPVYLKVAVELLLVALFLRVSDLSTLTRNSAILVTISAVVLPDDFFWSYLELPFMLLLFWLSAPKGIDFVKDF